MLTGLQHAHSGLRWLLLVLLITAVIKAFMGKSKGLRFFDKDRKLALFTMILAHVQLLIGFSMYFMKGYHQYLNRDAMKVDFNRFLGIEHMLGMLIAIILITIGYKKVKSNATDVAKFKAMAFYYTAALLLILASIPWPFRFTEYGWI